MRDSKYYTNCVHLLFFACLSFLGSCSSEELIDEPASRAVLFNTTKGTVVVENDTKTRAATGDPDPAMDSMDDLLASGREVLIYGARYTDGDSPAWGAGAQLFMNGLTGPVGKTGSDYRIDYSPLKYYYPNDDERYDFKLFFPLPALGQAPSGVTVLQPATGRPLGLRVDLSHRPDLLKATLADKSKTAQPLELEFEHMLTSVVLKIVKEDYEEPSDPSDPKPLKQDIYINRLAVSGMMRGTYDIIKDEFEPPVKVNSDPDLVDVVSGVYLFDPGYNRDGEYLVPSAGEEAKRIYELFLFPVAPDASEARDDMERYFFDIWLNERLYSFTVPDRNDTGWEGWKAGERYTYTIKVSKADIYIELDKDHISREPWKTEDKGEVTIGGKDN